jgi:hypothetical protein
VVLVGLGVGEFVAPEFRVVEERVRAQNCKDFDKMEKSQEYYCLKQKSC